MSLTESYLRRKRTRFRLKMQTFLRVFMFFPHEYASKLKMLKTVSRVETFETTNFGKRKRLKTHSSAQRENATFHIRIV